MKLAKNFTLLTGIALPIIFIITLSLIIFIPYLFVNPQYNFLYSKNEYIKNYTNMYVVEDNHLLLSPLPTTTEVIYEAGNPPLYLYDIKKDSSRQIDWDEAKNFNIDPEPLSPDGYAVEHRYSNAGIFELFDPGSYQSRYFISKGNNSKKLSGLNSNNYVVSEFKFIGWVK